MVEYLLEHVCDHVVDREPGLYPLAAVLMLVFAWTSEKGGWTASVEYGNVHILPKNEMDGETCVLDIRTVEVKGQKRKLLLTQREDGDAQKIYKLKKSKLEENIKVGFI